jgi:DNA-binding transcriptional LysR family regulator
VTDAFRRSGLQPPQARLISFSIHLRRRLLETGRYLSVIPSSLLEFSDLKHSLKPLPVQLPIEPRPVAIVTLRNRTLSPVAQLFIDCAKEVTRPLSRRG